MSEEKEQAQREELDERNMPRALNYLINEVSELRSMLDDMKRQLQLDYDRRRPITIEKAAEVLSLKERAVKKLVKEGSIPYYKMGTTYYFFEEEIIEYVKKTRVKPYWDILYKRDRR